MTSTIMTYLKKRQLSKDMYKTVNDLVKQLFISKTMAWIDRYQAGKLFYRFTTESTVYEFSIDTVSAELEGGDSEEFDAPIYYLSADLGTTPFKAEVRASELTRWIKVRATTNELKKIK